MKDKSQGVKRWSAMREAKAITSALITRYLDSAGGIDEIKTERAAYWLKTNSALKRLSQQLFNESA